MHNVELGGLVRMSPAAGEQWIRSSGICFDYWGDCADGKGRLSNPTLLATGGLVSAAISFRKNWLSI